MLYQFNLIKYYLFLNLVNFMILFKHFKNSISTSITLSKINNNKYKFLDSVRIFFIRFFFSIPRIRNLIKSKNVNSDDIINGKKFVNGNFSTREILNKIESKGYFDELNFPKSVIEKIKENINDKNCFLDTKGFNLKDKNTSKLQFKNLDELAFYSMSNKIKHLIVKFKDQINFINSDIALDPFVNIAKKYLNSEKVTCKVECYISNPFQSNEYEMKKNAQYYHYDCDYKKFLKIFIYLNDVDIDSGPHVYIEKTHKKKIFKHILAERINDDEINKFYGFSNQKIFTKNEGSIIIEDTFGLHKGVVPKSKSRYVLILEYGSGKSILKNDQYFYI